MVLQSYATKQRAALRSYLQSTNGQHVLVEDIVAHFEASHEPMGRATIYRNLERLEQEGLVQRFTTNGRGAACFQYLSAPQQVHECFHLMCEQCGRLQHVECTALSDMETHIMKSHAFRINPLRTVMYGLCHDCMELEKNTEKREAGQVPKHPLNQQPKKGQAL